MACKAFDGQVVRHDQELTELTKQFVPVRIVRMNDADLDLFQFDYDLTWSAFFMNPDGAIYGRYGTRAAQDGMTHMSLASLKKAMRQALELHKDYPNNRQLFEGKRGSTPRFKSVREIAPLKKQLASKGHGDSAQQDEGCIHCHMVYEGIHDVEYSEGTFKQEMIWVYPMPENIGLVMDVDEGTKVKYILPNSFAEKSGLEGGDVIHKLNGQIILSQADIQWVLHWLPTPGTIEVHYFRDKKLYYTTLTVEGNWRKRDISWRGSMWGLHPKLGLWAPELSIDEKKTLGLASDRLALRVQYPSESIKKAGLKVNDIIVSFDSSDKNQTSLQLNVNVRLNYKPGSQVPVAVLRDGKRVELTIPLE